MAARLYYHERKSRQGKEHAQQIAPRSGGRKQQGWTRWANNRDRQSAFSDCLATRRTLCRGFSRRDLWKSKVKHSRRLVPVSPGSYMVFSPIESAGTLLSLQLCCLSRSSLESLSEVLPCRPR